MSTAEDGDEAEGLRAAHVEDVPLANLSSRTLKTNSKNHSWAHGAIAELTDNARDAGASQCAIHVTYAPSRREPRTIPVLVVEDNGCGLSREDLHQMMSTGFCDKLDSMIGEYGNGFKSSSMWLADDCLIITSHAQSGTYSVGIYSHTFHEKEGVKEIRLPCVTYKFSSESEMLEPVTEPGWGKGQASASRDSGAILSHESSLHFLTKYSLYCSEEELKQRVWDVFFEGTSGVSMRGSGTHLELFNLVTDLDFASDPGDIRQTTARHTVQSSLQPEPLPLDVSLREYLSLLYSEPRMDLVLRGQTVEQQNLSMMENRSKLLNDVMTYEYKPKGGASTASIIAGVYSSKDSRGQFQLADDEFGTLMYHRGRLIRAKELLGRHTSLAGWARGVWVIVFETGLEVKNNKQEYMKNSEYSNFIKAVETRLDQFYCNLVADGKLQVDDRQGKRSLAEAAIKEYEEIEKEVSWLIAANNSGLNWVLCDDCGKWRSMPSGYACEGRWTCMHPDHKKFNLRFAGCDKPKERPDMEDAWRKEWIKLEGWAKVEMRIKAYKDGTFTVPNEDGSFDSHRLGEFILPQRLGSFRKAIPYSPIRWAVQQAIVSLETDIGDSQSAQWTSQAKSIPESGTSKGPRGAWGALTHLTDRWDNMLKTDWAKEDDAEAQRMAQEEELGRQQQEEEEEVLHTMAKESRKRKQSNPQPANSGTDAKRKKAALKKQKDQHRKTQEKLRLQKAVAKQREADERRQAELEKDLHRKQKMLERYQRDERRREQTALSASSHDVNTSVSVTPMQRPQDLADGGAGPSHRRTLPTPPPPTPDLFPKPPSRHRHCQAESTLSAETGEPEAEADGRKEPEPEPEPELESAGGQFCVPDCPFRVAIAMAQGHQMYQCSGCDRFFHPECVGSSLSELRQRGNNPQDEFTCAQHKPVYIANMLESRKYLEEHLDSSWQASGQRAVVGPLGAAPLAVMSGSSGGPSLSVSAPQQPPTWPKDCRCTYRNWLVWGDMNSPSEMLRVRNSKFNFIQGVAIRRLHASHPICVAKPGTNHYGLFATRNWGRGDPIGLYTGLVSEGHSTNLSALSEYNMEIDMERHGFSRPNTIIQIDANYVGNETRFINDFHNVAVRPNVRYIDEHDAAGNFQVGVYVSEKVLVGDEFLVSYGPTFRNISGGL